MPTDEIRIPLHRRLAGRVVVGALVLGLGLAARSPTTSESEVAALADQFQLVRQALAPKYTGSAEHVAARAVRAVHPSLSNIDAWISSVGASVAIADLDEDGLANDLCLVEVRTDQVLVFPAPPDEPNHLRFPPFELVYPQPHNAWAAPMGCLAQDLNQDGWTDLMVYFWGQPPVMFLRRDRPLTDGTEAFETRFIADSSEIWNTTAATTADLDGDGWLDLVVGNYFDDGARILDPEASGSEHMHQSMSRAFNGGRNHILLSAGRSDQLSFVDRSDVLSEEIRRGWTLAMGAADLDGDLLPELYLANDFGPDRLLHNRSTPGNPRFELVEARESPFVPSSKHLGRDSFKGMGTDFADVDGDGRLDIYVSNIATKWALQESHFLWLHTGDDDALARGEAPYRDHSEPLGVAHGGWGWGTRLADFDQDGQVEAVQATGFVRGETNRWVELQELATGNDEMLANPAAWPRFSVGDDLSGHDYNQFFTRGPSGRFVEIGRAMGLDPEPTVTRGIATGDLDGDGDLDLVAANQWTDSVIWWNQQPTPNQGLLLTLVMPVGESSGSLVGRASGVWAPTTRPAIGASARLRMPDGRTVPGFVDGGNGHSGSRSQEVHFGLGAIPEDKELVVDLHWRDGTGRAQRRSVTVTPGRHTLILSDRPVEASL